MRHCGVSEIYSVSVTASPKKQIYDNAFSSRVDCFRFARCSVSIRRTLSAQVNLPRLQTIICRRKIEALSSVQVEQGCAQIRACLRRYDNSKDGITSGFGDCSDCKCNNISDAERNQTVV